jgi:hypothetical protein
MPSRYPDPQRKTLLLKNPLAAITGARYDINSPHRRNY